MYYNSGYFNKYCEGIDAKIAAAKPDIMRHGNRSEIGFAETARRIKQGAMNLFAAMGPEVNEPVNAAFTNFSLRPGLNDVSNVAAVDIIDIGIQATRQSVMGYLTAERAMEKPIDTAWYQTLVAMNDAGGFNEKETVYNPFTPIDTKINLGAATKIAKYGTDGEAFPTAEGDVTTFDLGATPIVKKNVVIVAKDGTGEVIATGSDLKGDGVIYWDNGTVCDAAKINYETGKIEVTGLDTTAAPAVEITANIERTAQKDGANTLRLKPETTTITLRAIPNRIVLENSFEDNAYMNKQAFNAANIGVNIDFGRRAINQLLQVFVYYLDLTSVKKTTEVMIKANQEYDILDLTDYLISSSQAATKNDFVNKALLSLNKKLQKRTGKGATAILVDTEAAVVLGACDTYFHGNPTFDTNLDGMIGTFRGLPVIRHHACDGIIDALQNDGDLYGFVGMLYKSPDGNAAPTMFGEYLPPLKDNISGQDIGMIAA